MVGLNQFDADAKPTGPRYTLETSPPRGALLRSWHRDSLVAPLGCEHRAVHDQSGTVSPTCLGRAC